MPTLPAKLEHGVVLCIMKTRILSLGMYEMGYNVVRHLRVHRKRGKAMHTFVCIVPVGQCRVTTEQQQRISAEKRAPGIRLALCTQAKQASDFMSMMCGQCFSTCIYRPCHL